MSHFKAISTLFCFLFFGGLIINVHCSSNENLTSARNLSGTWEGTAPNGAFYEDNVENPNCAYEADLFAEFVHSGSDLSGTLTLKVREANRLLSSGPSCTPVGTSITQALTGEVGSSRLNIYLADGVTIFSGTYTSDIIDGEFVVNATNGVIGTFTMRRK